MVEITEGSFVYSAAGRDTGGLFVILEIGDGYAYLCDGRLRKTDRAKKKKLKHIKPAGGMNEALAEKIKNGEKLTNPEVRRAIAAYAASLEE